MKAEPGQITALIGPNGAGKTTLINAVTGFVRASGTVHIGDQSLTGLPRHTRRRLGLARTWPAGELFDALSILDNVRKGHWHDHNVSSVRPLPDASLPHRRAERPQCSGGYGR